MFRKKKIYLDYAATTPLDLEVARVMRKVQQNFWMNPGGLHSGSVAAKQISEQGRSKVAKLLSARSEEIIFTRGGTESVNIALQGVVAGAAAGVEVRATEGNAAPGQGKSHVITSSIEHAAVRDTLRAFVEKGMIELTELPVGGEGFVNVKDLKESLRPETVLVSIMYANNEIGSIQSIREIMKAVRHHRKQYASQYPIVHTDAIAAGSYLDLNTQKLGVDLLSLSGSKIYGPKSVGILYKKSGVDFMPMMYGGNQELGVRPGTEDVVGIVGFAKALELVLEKREMEVERLVKLQQYFSEKLKAEFPEVRLNGFVGVGEPAPTYDNVIDESGRRPTILKFLPNIIHASFPGITGERLVIELDAHSIAVSSKSACKSNEDGESHVLRALYGDNVSESMGSVRFSMGRSTTRKDLDRVIVSLQKIMQKVKTEQDILK